mmetsp:Transcript_25948/g.46107  ORF Transcript_25948/g.46107 Transcript_25948/m.46107 type:complete len:116 (-) Transcript_25948:22-369(-)
MNFGWESCRRHGFFDATTEGSLDKALVAAADKKSKDFLEQNPVKASWADATDRLLEQYENMIQLNAPVKKRHITFVNFMALAFRLLVVSLALFVSYYEIKYVRKTWRILDAWIPG